MLTDVFKQLLSMAVTALPVMAVVLAARWLLRKAPKKYTYLLWLVVAFRLLCPVAPESPVGLVQAEETTQQVTAVTDTYIEPTLTYRDNGGFTPDYDVLLNRGYTPNEQGEIVTNEAGTREALQVKDLLSVAAVVWLLGIAAVAAYLIFSTLRLRRQVATAVWREENIWECDNIPTPFVLGLLRPRIYIPFRMTETERTYILAHERYHIRHGDQWAKLLGLVILAIYWWNPAVWLCWVLFCRDMEMRCDEAVLAELGDGVKREYSLSLISFALDRRAPMALAFGEHDAAKRVKNVLRWKKAKPAVIFLAAAAVILVALVCGTNAKSASWVKAEGGGGTFGTASFTWSLKEPVKAWAIYEDIYENGKLISSSPRIMDGFQEDGGGVSKRRETITLSVRSPSTAGVFSGTLECAFEGIGGATWELNLPKDRYTGMGVVIRDGSDVAKKQKLAANDTAVLYTILLSADPEGKITIQHLEKSLPEVNDTVVQYRLVTSTEDLSALTSADLAGTLYQMRVPVLQSADDAKPLLEKLGAGALGSYEVRTFEEGRDKILLVAYDRSLTMEQQLEMHNIATMLLALVQDVTRVDFSCYKETTGNLFTFYGDHDQPDSWAKNMGYADIKAMGKTPVGIRTLMQYIGWNPGSEDTASPLAQSLYAARNEPEKLLQLLAPDQQLGRCEFTDAPSGCLTMLFHDAPMSDDLRDTVMWKHSMVMLALLDNYDETSWNWMDGSTLSYEQNSGLWNTRDWLTEQGLDAEIRSYGTSSAQVQILLEKLNLYDSISAQQLFAQAQTLDVMELTEVLLGTQLWGGVVTGGTVNWPGNFGPSVHFKEVPGNPSALDAAMARRAVVLMKLQPQEVSYVLWSYPNADGNLVQRGLYAAEMGGILALSSDTQVYQNAGSSTDLARLIRFLNLDDKVFLHYAEAGNSMAAALNASNVFVSALLEQDAVGHLLDDHEPYDIYYDLDTWNDRSVEVLDCRLYYSLTRAQFRQFLNELEEIPAELKDVELEGDEADTAHIAVSGQWSRAEAEAINADLPARTQIGSQTPALTIAAPQEQKITAAWFADGQFHFSNDDLPTLTLTGMTTLSHTHPYTLTLSLSDDSVDSLTVSEDYYASTASGTQIEKNTYTLPRSSDGTFALIIQRRSEDQAEKAVYYVSYDGGKFVFRVTLPDVSDTSPDGQPFYNILGYDGIIKTEGSPDIWTLRTYYAVENGETFPIAETFGFGAPEDYSVDVDGDGVAELVANVQYGGDGARRVYVYQRRADGIYQGSMTTAGLPNFDDWGANASWEEYDPAAKIFRLHYAQKGTEEYAILETRGLERFEFTKYAP